MAPASSGQARVDVPGSAPQHENSALGAADPNETITVTIVLRRPASSATLENELLSGKFKHLSREEAARVMGADPSDVASLTSFLQQYGLAIVDENLPARTLRVRGTVQQLDRAFGIHLSTFRDRDGNEYLSYTGSITIPAVLSGIIVAVLGLDQRPIARPR